MLFCTTLSLARRMTCELSCGIHLAHRLALHFAPGFCSRPQSSRPFSEGRRSNSRACPRHGSIGCQLTTGGRLRFILKSDAEASHFLWRAPRRGALQSHRTNGPQSKFRGNSDWSPLNPGPEISAPKNAELVDSRISPMPTST